MSWDLPRLEELLIKQDGWAVHLENGCLCVTNEDGLDAYVAVSGEQIVVESLLFPKKLVNDAAALNDAILKTHQFFPLTTIGISSVEEEEYYISFGSLSSQSKEESVVIEIETLFDNVTGFLDAYEEYLN
jgi:uncharacterized protein YjfI (DUF2170 family)